ncbi:MAG: fructose-6-phosphate aldolase [Actinomycetota bacterium]
MKLWLDTASIDEIREINRWGVLGGVTTNPTLMAKESGVDFDTRLKEIATEVDGPVCGEVTNLESTKIMVEQGLKISEIAPNIVVKIPVTADGYAAVRELTKRGIRTNMTLCFSPAQAILAAEAGASYISPFVGRLDDISSDGLSLLADICAIFDVQGYTTEVLSASLRSPQSVVDSAKAGADVATIPYKVFEALVQHPLTESGLKKFGDDWTKYQASLQSSPQ